MVGVVHKHPVGVELRKKVDAQVIDEIGSSTIMGCGFVLIKVGDRRLEQEEQSLTVPAPVRRRDQGVPSPSVPIHPASLLFHQLLPIRV